MLALIIILVSLGVFLKYSKEIGRLFAKNKGVVGFVILIGFAWLIIIIVINSQKEAELEREKKAKSDILWKSKNFSKEECLKHSSVIAEAIYAEKNSFGEPLVLNAIKTYSNCIVKLKGDPTWAKTDQFLNEYYRKQIELPGSKYDKIPVMRAFLAISPEDSSARRKIEKLESEYEVFKKKEEKDRVARLKAEELAEKKRKRSKGVSIGMTREDVLASSWGRPDKVNKTTNAYGTREQWVYGVGNYLYFEDGILTTIQN